MVASSSLLAVTTGLPAASAASTRLRAGSMPPMSSTTMSTDGSFTTEAASAQSRSPASDARRAGPLLGDVPARRCG